MADLDLASRNRTTVESGIYYHKRDYKGVVEATQRFIAINPNDWPGHYFLGVGYAGVGRTLDAVSEYKKAVELSHGDTFKTSLSGFWRLQANRDSRVRERNQQDRSIALPN